MHSDTIYRVPKNLNSISYEAAIEMIVKAISAGVNVSKVFVDTVGDPEAYEKMLTIRFENKIEFTVRKKADSLFKVVSAASICAKVTRDYLIENWKFTQAKFLDVSAWRRGCLFIMQFRGLGWLVSLTLHVYINGCLCT
jgi:ribonuclease H2 subunit A